MTGSVAPHLIFGFSSFAPYTPIVTPPPIELLETPVSPKRLRQTKHFASFQLQFFQPKCRTDVVQDVVQFRLVIKIIEMVVNVSRKAVINPILVKHFASFRFEILYRLVSVFIFSRPNFVSFRIGADKICFEQPWSSTYVTKFSPRY